MQKIPARKHASLRRSHVKITRLIKFFTVLIAIGTFAVVAQVWHMTISQAQSAKAYDAFDADETSMKAQGRIIFGITRGTPQDLTRKEQRVLDRLAKKNAKFQVKVAIKLDKIRARILTVAPGMEEAVIAELAQDPEVAYAEPDFTAQAALIPNDSSFANQYGLHNTGQTIGTVGVVDADIDAPEAWDVVTGSASGQAVKIAVLDSGIDQNHPDLVAKIVGNQNFTSSSTVDDIFGHGTHVAGIVAAVTNNASGVAGACPDCTLLNGKVLGDADGSGYYSWIANGIIWAVDSGAKVINMSLSGSASSQLLADAVAYADSKGVVVVAAAGNSGSTTLAYPAAIEPAIAVAATTNRDLKASYSNYGAGWVDIAAPGSNIYSTLPNHAYTKYAEWGSVYNYGFLNGTSMATPMVAGAAGLLYTSPYGTSAMTVRSRLLETADQIANTGTYWANGRLNVANAVGFDASPSATPTPTASPPTSTPTPIPTNTPTPLPTAIPTPVLKAGLLGTYYNNLDFTGTSVMRDDLTVNFNWGTNSPISGVAPDTFSVRWTGFVTPQYSQMYTFYTRTNDGARLWVDNQQIINRWVNQGTTEVSGQIALSAGVRYPIVMEYFDNKTGAVAQLRWSSLSRSKQIIPSNRLSH